MNNIKQLPMSAETTSREDKMHSTAQTDKEEGHSAVPSTMVVRGFLYVSVKLNSYNSDYIKQNVGKNVAKHIAHHEDAVEQTAVIAPVFVRRVFCNKNTLNRPRHLSDMQRREGYSKKEPRDEAKHKRNGGRVVGELEEEDATGNSQWLQPTPLQTQTRPDCPLRSL